MVVFCVFSPLGGSIAAQGLDLSSHSPVVLLNASATGTADGSKRQAEPHCFTTFHSKLLGL
eukprot:4926291-Amphidinium_carterae.1